MAVGLEGRRRGWSDEGIPLEIVFLLPFFFFFFFFLSVGKTAVGKRFSEGKKFY